MSQVPKDGLGDKVALENSRNDGQNQVANEDPIDTAVETDVGRNTPSMTVPSPDEMVSPFVMSSPLQAKEEIVDIAEFQGHSTSNGDGNKTLDEIEKQANDDTDIIPNPSVLGNCRCETCHESVPRNLIIIRDHVKVHFKEKTEYVAADLTHLLPSLQQIYWQLFMTSFPSVGASILGDDIPNCNPTTNQEVTGDNHTIQDMKCGICRKSKNDDQLLLCDDCNGAFHTFCLRPPLKRIPAGDWFCPKCSQERAPKTRSLRTIRESSDDESDEEEDEDGKKRKTRSKQKAGKAKSKRQRIKSSSDESSDEKQKAPTKKKQKRQMAGTDESTKSLEKQLASATPKVKVHLKGTPTSTPNASSDETKTVSERCQHYLDKMYHSRLVTSLDSLPKAAATMRSRAHAEKSLDLNEIKEKVPTYKTVRQFFKDLKAMVAHAKDVFQDKPRKLTQLDDLQTLITEMESATLPVTPTSTTPVKSPKSKRHSSDVKIMPPPRFDAVLAKKKKKN